MRFLYLQGIRVYGIGILFYSIFNEKARLWLKGRKNWKSRLKDADISGAVWIHCASLGEFEQGRPLLETIKKRYPEKKILLTFFSPSGYEIRKNYPLADCVSYLPLDTPRNARTFVKLVKPEFAIFVKYEVWHNVFKELKKAQIKHYIISAIYRESQIYFKGYGSWFRKTLKNTSQIFTQDQLSVKLLEDFDLTNAIHAGDTRFDRVFEISQKSKKLPKAERFSQGKLTLIAGSTWPADEKILSEVVQKFTEVKLIIAPHQVDQKHINSLEELFPGSLRWSGSETNFDGFQTMIIDSIGLLSSLYASGNIAFIGGGFGSGIHNTLEPACFGLPVIFGPRYSKFKEAVDLISEGAAYSILNSKDLIELIQELTSNQEKRKVSGNAAQNYVEKNRGATEIILNGIID